MSATEELSPEATSNQPLDHRSDLFSLGVILYLLCTGAMPFNGRTPADIVRKIRAGKYKPLEELTQVPEALSLLVRRLLSANPDDRPERGQEVAAELTEIARQGLFESSSSAGGNENEPIPYTSPRRKPSLVKRRAAS